MAEDELLQRAMRGEREALEELCRREWHPLYGMIYRAVGNPSDAQDVTQETFLRSLPALDRFRTTGAPFRAFLQAVARNILRDRWKRKALGVVTLDRAHQLSSPASTPEEHVVAEAEVDQLRRAILNLRADYQMVLRLRVFEGKSSAEAAALMGRSPAAVRQLQHRAAVALRDELCKEKFHEPT